MDKNVWAAGISVGVGLYFLIWLVEKFYPKLITEFSAGGQI